MSTIPQAWFPSFLNWQPVYGSDGKVKEGLRRLGNDPGEVYGTLDPAIAKKQPIRAMRGKLCQAAFFQLPVGIVRVPIRLACLIAGDFIAPGVKAARIAWQLECEKWLQNPVGSAPSSRRRHVLTAEYVLWQLAKHVAKLGLCVLAIVPLWITAVLGCIFNPYDAGYVFGTIENWCSRDEIPISVKCRKIRKFQIKFTDMIAPCMQPKRVMDQKNVYRSFFDYNSGTLRSMIRAIDAEFQEKQTFFQYHFLGTSVDLSTIRPSLRQYRDQLSILGVSSSDSREADGNGDLRNRELQWGNNYSAVAAHLTCILENLQAIEKAREDLVEARVKLDGYKGNQSNLDYATAKAAVIASFAALNDLLGVAPAALAPKPAPVVSSIPPKP